MLRLSTARDASTCLRCNLRLVLRQIQHRRYQSSDESPLPTQDFSTSTSAPSSEQQQPQTQPSRFRLIRTRGSHGKIRGKKGSQRRVESAEALSIASLGQSSEVIVLRDLHEPRPGKKLLDPNIQSAQNAASLEPKPPALTARDIENMSGRRAVRPQPAEVFESIDALKPDEGIHVVTEDEFGQKFAALNKGYTIGQLKGYLMQKTAPGQYSPFKTNKFRRVLTESNKPAPTEISSRSDALQILKRTHWHTGTTPITKRLPMVDFSMSIGRKMNNKDDVIQSILRHAWALGIEEEQAAIGEMEFLLSPMQFGLLLTKNSETLKPLLESTKFYKNSRFQLHQPDHVIRIVGPRAEAEAISHVLTEAYAPARSADISLKTFHDALKDNPSGFTLQDILTPAQLSNIMGLTRTYIHYDLNAKRLRIASFVDVAINDAHRLLVALLPSNSRSRVTRLYDSHEPDDCRLEPIISTKNLPSHAKHRQLGRWVTAAPRLTQSDVDPSPLDAGVDEQPERTGVDSTLNVPLPRFEPMRSRNPIIKEAVSLMKSCLNTSEKDAPEIESPIWPKKAGWNLWRAHVGLALHDLQDKDHYPGRNGLSSSLEDPAAYPKQAFSFQVPSLIGLLSTGSRRGSWSRAPPERTELTAHLIPSPFEQTGTLASATLPTMQLRFDIRDPAQVQEDDMRISALLPSGKRIVLRDIRAVMTTEAVQLNLPSHPADLRFEREQSMVSKRSIKDPRIKSFIEAIFESMANDTSLRAPPALQLSVPVPTQSQTVLAKYLFAGFEYNEIRRYDLNVLGPDYSAIVQSTEAGVTGGRRLEVSLRYTGKRLNDGGDDALVEGLADASVKLIRILARYQVKEPDVHSRESDLAYSGNVGFRRLQLDTGSGREGDRAIHRPTKEESRQDRYSAHKPKNHPRDETGRVAKEALQAQVINDRDSSVMEKVAKQEQSGELDIDQDLRVEETASDEGPKPETIAIEKPETQTRSFDAEHDASLASEQESGTEPSPTTSTSTSSTIETHSSEQVSTQAPQEPADQEAKADETKAPEGEPLSVRLRRMMGGGA
ncbi:hypothetical protein QM012_004624 [Aureobasidium pullulans]|uniref:Uncharacterized protein n=1 Tax=Aureobasidium pullulans TaxID=5580 RepID=A0ABR0TVA5_AURPU